MFQPYHMSRSLLNRCQPLRHLSAAQWWKRRLMRRTLFSIPMRRKMAIRWLSIEQVYLLNLYWICKVIFYLPPPTPPCSVPKWNEANEPTRSSEKSQGRNMKYISWDWCSLILNFEPTILHICQPPCHIPTLQNCVRLFICRLFLLSLRRMLRMLTK